MRDAGINAKIWLDGSFLTEKINPKDIDFIAVVDSRVYDSGTAEQRAVLDGLVEGELWKPSFLCDTNVVYVDPPEYTGSTNVLAYWERRFGFSVNDHTPKGIVIIEVSAVSATAGGV